MKIFSLIMILFLVGMDAALVVYSYTVEGYSVDDYRALGIIVTVVVTMSLPLISRFIEKMKIN